MNILLCESAESQIVTVGKARTDMREILLDTGYEEIMLFHNGSAKLIIMLEIVGGCLRMVVAIGKGDRIFSVPILFKNCSPTHFRTTVPWKENQGVKVNMLIHDVIAMRNESWMTEDRLTVFRFEVKAWHWIDQVICHSENMRAVFRKVSNFDKYSAFGSFDYLYEGPICMKTYAS